MDAQQCDCTGYHWVVHLKMVKMVNIMCVLTQCKNPHCFKVFQRDEIPEVLIAIFKVV